MNKKLIKTFSISTLAIFISGTLLHFTYEWTNNNTLIGLFSAVNESTWEHLKLAFFPMLIFGIISYSFIKYISNNFIEGLTIGILITLLFIVIFFYGYQAILGKNIDFLNILDYYLAVLAGQFAFYKIASMDDYSTNSTQLLSLAVLFIFFISFIAFTFYTPYLEIFRDPIDSTFGI